MAGRSPASWQPATGVGGDCFDAIPFGRSRLGLSIADVVGKGIPAALLMSNLQAAVRAFATDAAQPAELCQQVNRILCGHIAEGRFISFFYCVVDCELGMLTFANAGHYAPILVRADGRVERLGAGGPVLGVFPDGGLRAGTGSPIGTGDRLVLFTDGITRSARRRRSRSSARIAWSHLARRTPGLQRAGAPGPAHARRCRRSPAAGSRTTRR